MSCIQKTDRQLKTGNCTGQVDECIEWQVNFGYQKFHKFLIKIERNHLNLFLVCVLPNMDLCVCDFAIDLCDI